MKVTLDNIIFASQKFGGISVVWYEHLSRLLRDGRFETEFVEFSPVDNILRKKLDIPGSSTRRIPASLRKVFKYLPVMHCSREPFIFHSSFFRYCPSRKAVNIVTVHDFTNELYQTGSGPKKERLIKNRATRHADYVICISENTRKDFFRFFPDFPKERVRVIYNGVSPDYHIMEGDAGWNYPFDRKNYLLFVGERGGYKNFALLAEALKDVTLDLVVVGKPLTDCEKESLEGINGRVFDVGRAGSDVLNILYNNAYALVYPSLYEGFGLPVIEAQKAGCPVIACKASSIPEIIGETPLMMDSPTREELISRIKLLMDPDIRRQTIEKGLINAGRFSWDKTYKAVTELYIEALENYERQA